MKECARPYYILNGTVRECPPLDEDLVHKGISLYEVIRLMDGKFLFLEDHLARLFNSLELAGLQPWISTGGIREGLLVLSEKNRTLQGNVKIVMNLQEDGSRHFLAYFIQHRYPSPRDYKHGVKVITYPYERTDPNKKIWRPEFRRLVADKLRNEGAYEALLTDPGSCITEASKANVFAIRRGRIVTPPDGVILPGITRHYVLQICSESSLEVTMEKIPLGTIPNLEGLFLTGTSLHVLPVSWVNDMPIQVRHPVMLEIMNKFQLLIKEHLN
jgi:branched-chain amino acid aminotransferase